MPTLAPVAQWIEQPPPKRQVAGSIPARGTIKASSCVNTFPFSSEYIHWNKEGANFPAGGYRQGPDEPTHWRTDLSCPVRVKAVAA